MMEQTKADSSARLTRREALRILGAGAAAAALPATASGAKAPQFPRGAIIRTILKDLPASALGTGATLFHEHLSLNLPYFGPPRATPPPPPATADVNYIIGEIKTGFRPIDGLVGKWLLLRHIHCGEFAVLA